MEGQKYCSNCGEELKEGAKFCQKCGVDVKPTETAAQNAEPKSEQKTESFTDSIAKNNPFPSIFKKTKAFLVKNKKPVIISAGAIAVIVAGIVAFNTFWDFTKLEWNVSYSAANLEHISGRKIELGIVAEDREKNDITDKISYDISAGDIKVEGKEITWTIPDESGKYTISAIAPSGKTITKEFNYIAVDHNILNGIVYEETEEEKAAVKKLADADRDGLTDEYEDSVSKTDPKKADTDEDGLLDGDEISLGLDPKKADSKGDGKKDGERDLTYTFEENGIKVEINGQGNIASSSADIIANSSFKNIKGLSDTIYNFSTSGKLKNAKVTIKYDEHNLIANSINEKELTVYYLNDETKKLEKVEGSVVDPAANTVTVELKHFSKYVLGNSNVEADALATDILFVIDNSISMYTEKQVNDAGYNRVTGADGNDADYKRLSLTKDLIDRLSGSFKFGVSEFSGSYKNLQKFTDNKDSAKEAVEKMRAKWSTNTNGTYIATSMNGGIDEFKKDDNTSHYIVLLTDGKDTSSTFKSKKASIISNAKAKDVKICTIGLGNDIDTAILKEISTATGCDYYNANETESLDEIFSVIGSNVGFNYSDTDEDNSVDGMIVSDSGFIVARDGFSFPNFRSNKSDGGHCYGMATFAMLRYTNTLPESLSYRTINDHQARGYNIRNTYFTSSESLYNFTFKTEGLNIFFQNEPPADYRDRVENNTWKVNTKYRTPMENAGIKFIEVNGDDDAKAVGAEKIETGRVQIGESALDDYSEKDEHYLLDTIWRLYILQFKDDKRVRFDKDPDEAFNLLKTRLANGQPTVLAINNNHAINATKLVQDNNDPNKFKIAVYDNNFPGKTRYIEVTRKKMSRGISFNSWVNEYEYSFRYDAHNDGETEDTIVSIASPVVQ